MTSISARTQGFTLIELMMVVVIIGVLAAIAIPNFVQMQARAKESALKSNMHTTQLAAEDYAVRNDGAYPADVADFQSTLPDSANGFLNPFTGLREFPVDGTAANPGEVGYEDVGTPPIGYAITGYGMSSLLPLILSSGS
jgi:prepilin-type N-terminal cleavage/methylation domain-containing protein